MATMAYRSGSRGQQSHTDHAHWTSISTPSAHSLQQVTSHRSPQGIQLNALSSNRAAASPLTGLFKGVAVAVGLAAEAVQHAKEKKRGEKLAQQQTQANGSVARSFINSRHDDTSETWRDVIDSADDAGPDYEYEAPCSYDHEDERIWDLDDAVDSADTSPIEDGIEARTLDSIPAPSVASTRPTRLSCPVIIPQRRPGSKGRGFVRAYAPVLSDCGIDQESFLRFLKCFHKEAKASPIFDAVIIAAGIAGCVSSVIAAAVTMAVTATAMAGREAQERWRTNNFLDEANKQIFMPKGLYAMLVTFKPLPADNQVSIATHPVDMAAKALVKYSSALNPTSPGDEAPKPTTKQKMQNLRISSAQTHGQEEMPVECAPLIFPALDALATDTTGNQHSPKSLRHKAKSSSKFVQDYLDRRAQATYARDNPDSTLTQQMDGSKPQFASKFADPNHSASNGHPISLLTGGYINPTSLGDREQHNDAGGVRSRAGPVKGIQRLLKQDVLYLTVVNMPSEEELAEAGKLMEDAKRNGLSGIDAIASGIATFLKRRQI